jgi:ATP-dependent Clp protease ATP-binding subunit ClpA
MGLRRLAASIPPLESLPAMMRWISSMNRIIYREYIEKDSAFERRFAQVLVEEPTVPDTVNIMRGIREKYETHHGVRILDTALVLAAQLAKQYLTSRRLPDSAIDSRA